MPNLTADRVKETTTTTGTGTITLAGAVAQFRSFASAFADGNVVQYAIVGQTGTEWEVGNGTLGASGTTLARTTVLASSNANAAVNFSAGTKDVFATVTAAHLLAAVLGPSSATDNAVVVFNSTTGKLVQNTPVTLNPSTGSIDFPISATLTMHVTGTDGIVGINSGGTIYATEAGGAVNWQLLRGNSQTMRLGSARCVAWNSDANLAAGALDVGEGRFAAGVKKTTDGGSSGVRGLQGGGAAVASAAALPVPTGRVFHVTGTTNITSITSTNFQAGVVITLIFDGILTVTDGSNLKLAGNFVTAADSTLSLVYDGTNWYETGRSTN